MMFFGLTPFLWWSLLFILLSCLTMFCHFKWLDPDSKKSTQEEPEGPSNFENHLSFLDRIIREEIRCVKTLESSSYNHNIGESLTSFVAYPDMKLLEGVVDFPGFDPKSLKIIGLRGLSWKKDWELSFYLNVDDQSIVRKVTVSDVWDIPSPGARPSYEALWLFAEEVCERKKEITYSHRAEEFLFRAKGAEVEERISAALEPTKHLTIRNNSPIFSEEYWEVDEATIVYFDEENPSKVRVLKLRLKGTFPGKSATFYFEFEFTHIQFSMMGTMIVNFLQEKYTEKKHLNASYLWLPRPKTPTLDSILPSTMFTERMFSTICSALTESSKIEWRL